jgi:hypothetical protein
MGDNMSGYNPDALVWLEAHIAQWVANPTAIGLTSAQTVDLAQAVTNARAAFTSVQSVRSESKDKTVAFTTAGNTMRAKAAPLIANIKNFADNSTDPSAVYLAAGVLPKNLPSPAAPPAQPTALTFVLNGDGTVTINFDATGPTGTVWDVTRKLAGETAFTHVGFADAATKSFTDASVAPGTASATYLVKGVRGSVTGLPSPALAVFFGTADGGAMSAAA